VGPRQLTEGDGAQLTVPVQQDMPALEEQAQRAQAQLEVSPPPLRVGLVLLGIHVQLARPIQCLVLQVVTSQLADKAPALLALLGNTAQRLEEQVPRVFQPVLTASTVSSEPILPHLPMDPLADSVRLHISVSVASRLLVQQAATAHVQASRCARPVQLDTSARLRPLRRLLVLTPDTVLLVLLLECPAQQAHTHRAAWSASTAPLNACPVQQADTAAVERVRQAGSALLVLFASRAPVVQSKPQVEHFLIILTQLGSLPALPASIVRQVRCYQPLVLLELTQQLVL